MSSQEAVITHRAKPDIGDRRDPWRLLDRLGLLVAAASGLALFLFIGRGGWYIDDFLNFSIAQNSSFDRDYIGTPIFGHPQPATRVVNWLLFRIAPLNYALAAGLVCLGVALATWLVYRILRLSFRPSPWLLVLTAMAGISGMWVPVTEWWAGGCEIAGCIVADALMVHAVLRCHLGPHRARWGISAGLWLAIGLCFYERALLGGLFAACFLVAVRCRTLRPGEILRVVRPAWTAYAALLGVAVAYLAYYATHHLVHTQPGYGRRELLHYLWVAWSHSMVPAAFGGTLRTQAVLAESAANPPLWWLTLCQLGLLALVVTGVRRRGLAALRGWVIFLPLFLAAQYAIATARLYVHHARLGLELRYIADLLPLLVLTIALTVLVPVPVAAPESDVSPAGVPGRDAPLPAAAVDPRSRRRELVRRRRQLVGAAGASIALVAVYLASSAPVAHRWVNGHNVGYVDNLRGAIAERDAAGPWSLYTTYVPPDVSLPTYGRYSQTPLIAQLVSGHRVSVDDPRRPMYVADVDGYLRPARFETESRTGRACSTAHQHRVPRTLDLPLPAGMWTVRLHYDVPRRTTLRFAVDTGTVVQEATGSFRGFSVSGSGELTFMARISAITAFRLDAPAAGSCISDVQIGRPVPVS